ncbi:unnamed protein product [Rhizoctonia solani]|uniref:Uncharacterized protein n=1 Tax=Rhizoctonia solani TaxID=456999 RepID=A0A8H3HFI5_9AGAM|nr:unnamed protein product [Rhizoctonia solani]
MPSTRNSLLTISRSLSNNASPSLSSAIRGERGNIAEKAAESGAAVKKGTSKTCSSSSSAIVPICFRIVAGQ